MVNPEKIPSRDTHLSICPRASSSPRLPRFIAVKLTSGLDEAAVNNMQVYMLVIKRLLLRISLGFNCDEVVNSEQVLRIDQDDMRAFSFGII